MGLTSKKIYAILNRKIEKIIQKVSSIVAPLNYEGIVETENLLPESKNVGSVYVIKQASSYGDAGTTVVWDGKKWGELGIIINTEKIKAIMVPELGPDGILTYGGDNNG